MSQRRVRASAAVNRAPPRRNGAITTILDEPAPIQRVLVNIPRPHLRADQLERIARYESRGLTTTRFISDDVRLLCIEPQIDWLFDKLEWGGMRRACEETIFPLTLEFLSSYRSFFPANHDVEGAVMDFRLEGQEFRLTMRQFAQVLGVAEGSVTCTPQVDNEQLQSFWSKIAWGEYHNNAKSAWIRHPAIRYLHMFMSNCLFARPSSSSINKTELGYLNLALHEIFAEEDWGMAEVDVASRVAMHIQHVANEGANQTAAIAIGGIVSMIARRVNINLGVYGHSHSIDGPLTLDIPTLIRKNALTKSSSRTNLEWIFRDDDGNECSVRLTRAIIPALDEEGVLFRISPALCTLRTSMRVPGEGSSRRRQAPREAPSGSSVPRESFNAGTYQPQTGFEHYMMTQARHQNSELAWQRGELEWQHQGLEHLHTITDRMYQMTFYSTRIMRDWHVSNVGWNDQQEYPTPPGFPYEGMAYPPYGGPPQEAPVEQPQEDRRDPLDEGDADMNEDA